MNARLARGYILPSVRDHLCSRLAGNRMLLNGIAITAVHPSLFSDAADSHTASKLSSSFVPVRRRSACMPNGFTKNSYARW